MVGYLTLSNNDHNNLLHVHVPVAKQKLKDENAMRNKVRGLLDGEVHSRKL